MVQAVLDDQQGRREMPAWPRGLPAQAGGGGVLGLSWVFMRVEKQRDLARVFSVFTSFFQSRNAPWNSYIAFLRTVFISQSSVVPVLRIANNDSFEAGKNT